VVCSTSSKSTVLADLTHQLAKLYSEIIYPRSFPPDARTNVPRPSQFGITDFEELFIPTPDGESLSAFFIRANKQHARNVTVLMFHGNAGNIGYRLPIAKILENELRCNVLMLQYRGYGLSSGNPNEKGLMIDAQTGLDYIRQRQELRNTKIVIYGQSIGGAVSIGLVARNQKHGDIAGVILENTFTSLKKLIPRSVGWHIWRSYVDPSQCFSARKIPSSSLPPNLANRSDVTADHRCPNPLPQWPQR
jgi:fermentation-respiration switch protein FrsA (DUF1100 family)